MVQLVDEGFQFIHLIFSGQRLFYVNYPGHLLFFDEEYQ